MAERERSCLSVRLSVCLSAAAMADGKQWSRQPSSSLALVRAPLERWRQKRALNLMLAGHRDCNRALAHIAHLKASPAGRLPAGERARPARNQASRLIASCALTQVGGSFSHLLG